METENRFPIRVPNRIEEVEPITRFAGLGVEAIIQSVGAEEIRGVGLTIAPGFPLHKGREMHERRFESG